MSLDVYLKNASGELLYERNITHNLNEMAKAAGIYDCLWYPNETGITLAHQLIEPLSVGTTKLATQKKVFEEFNAANGWGTWEHFLPFCAGYLQACRDHPDALVSVSR